MYSAKAISRLATAALVWAVGPGMLGAALVSDDFSTNTAANYVGSNSFGSGGSFTINSGGSGKLQITTGAANTYAVMRANAEFAVGERYRVDIGGTLGGSQSQFVMVSTNTAQPNMTSSYGWRIARDQAVPNAYRIQLLDNAANTIPDGTGSPPLTPSHPIFFPGVANSPDPQTIIVDRVSTTMFHFYRQQGAAPPQLIGMGVNSNLASAANLHVGVQGFAATGGTQHQYDNLNISPITHATSYAAFQKGVGGYNGAVDTYLTTSAPSTVQNSNISLRVANGATQALIRFDGVFGNGPNQIPLGAQILSATLSVQTRINDGVTTLDYSSYGVNSATTLSIHQLLTAFDASTATYNSAYGGNGVQTNGVEAATTADDVRVLANIAQGQLIQFDVTESLQNWADGDAALGWLIQQIAGSDDWVFWSQEGYVGPLLQVSFYMVPEPSTLGLVIVAAACLGLGAWRRRGNRG